jgi:hypothetical protein
MSLRILTLFGAWCVAAGFLSAEDLVAVKHLEEKFDGWSVCEGPNIRVYYKGRATLAEKITRVAEDTRTTQSRKWFGKEAAAWMTPCALYLHATKADYAAATGLPAGMPATAGFKNREGVVSRRIDLNGETPDLVEAIVPHELTHILLWSALGEKGVPPWANEGIAVLSEPRTHVDRHLRNLPRHREREELFQLADLMRLKKYPSARQMGPFYAQSISLVEMLVKEKSPETFIEFLRDCKRMEVEKAVTKHYACTIAELEQRWLRHAFEG